MGLPALIIATLSFALSLITFFHQHFSKFYRLGIAADSFKPNIKEEILFTRLTFINESSDPIIIYDVTILDEDEKPFPEGDGHLIFESHKVSSVFRTGVSTVTDEITSLLPITIAPYSHSSRYYAFYFTGQSSETIYNKSSYYLECETSKGLFINELTTFSYSFGYENRHGSYRLKRIFWHESKLRSLFNLKFLNRLRLTTLAKLKRYRGQ